MHLLHHQGKTIPYNIVLSQRKSMAIVVTADNNVEIRAPLKTSLKKIQQLAENRVEWINKHYSKQRHTSLKQLHQQVYQPDQTLWFKGTPFTIKASRTANIYFNETTVTVPATNLHETLTRFLWQQAQQQLQQIMAKTCEQVSTLGIQHDGTLDLKDLKAQWGSCSHDNKIRFNMRLIHMPVAFMEYVVLHELCHIKEKNHSPQFHALIAKLQPDHQHRRKLYRI